MATYTENYNLTMPVEDDYYNVEDFNENFETIDTLMAETESNINEVNEKIGVNDDTESTSLFGKLNILQTAVGNGTSVIKSIQHITAAMEKSKTSTTISINTVVPEKSFVIFERLHDDDAYLTNFSYKLNAKNIVCTHSSSSSWDATFGFWVIEFC